MNRFSFVCILSYEPTQKEVNINATISTAIIRITVEIALGSLAYFASNYLLILDLGRLEAGRNI